jgi:glutathione S-transferase
MIALMNDIAAEIDQWVDYVNSTVVPASQRLFDEADQKTFSITLNNFKKTLAIFESHLKLRNFLVGYSLTLADVTLVVNLIIPLQTTLDQSVRKEPFQTFQDTVS